MKQTLLGGFAATLNNPEAEVSAYTFLSQHWWDMDKSELKAIAQEALYLLSQKQEGELLENLVEWHEDEMEVED